MTSKRKIFICALTALGTSGCEPQAAEPQQAGATSQSASSPRSISKCTSTPCANTASGEDPQDIAIRKAREERDASTKGKDDQTRWKRTLYSDATRPQDLQVELIRAANFSMYLSPALGYIHFRQPRAHDTFEIELPLGTANSLCPEYAIDTVVATKSYAVVRKSCMLHEYKPNRYSMGSTYYLYDVETRTMRTVWQSQTSGRDDPFPDPSVEPTVTASDDSITIKWKATYPSEGKVRSLVVNTRYVRSNTSASRELVCTDLSAPVNENIEVGACEGGALRRVASATR